MRELSLNVMDIVQNSVRAGADLIKISVLEDTCGDTLTISVTDNGSGMDEVQLKNVTDPFFTTRTTRDIGLGVPLFKMAAEQTGGSFEIMSKPNGGTSLSAVFKPSSVDMTPLGDINSTVSILVRCNPNLDFIYRRTFSSLSFTLDTRELKEALGGEVSLDSPDVMQWIDEYLKEQTDLIINGGASGNEIIS